MPVRPALILVAVGIIAGGIGFALLSGFLGGTRADQRAPGTSPGATDAAGLGSSAPVIVAPQAVKASLVQASVVNERLALSSAALKNAINSKASAADIALILRKMSADSTYGGQVVARLARWPGTVAVADRLTALYAAIVTTADSGLGHALTDQKGYRSAGSAMLKTLRALPAVAAATAEAAATYGVAVPGSTHSSSAAPSSAAPSSAAP
jgi:hypothetical protein